MSRSENNGDDLLDQVQTYRETVLAYEALNDEIHKLIMANGGGTEGMSADEVEHYRELARKRDETLSEMRWMEQLLLSEDSENDEDIKS